MKLRSLSPLTRLAGALGSLVAVIALVLFVVTVGGCARAPLKKREDALRRASAPKLSDDLELAPLAEAVRRQATVLRAQPSGVLVFGKRTIARAEYAAGLDAFAALVESTPDKEKLYDAIRERFEFYEVYGGDGWGDVLVTSYFEPEIVGSRTRTGKFVQPLLKPPADLIEVPLAKFDEKLGELGLGPVRGRLVAAAGTPTRLQLLPYFTREEIDGTVGSGALARRGLELAWVDPIDAFFMQVQGSGTVVFSDGTRLRLGYGDQNGHRYESIGKFLLDKLPKDRISLQTIEAHLRTLSEADFRAVLNRNPSYVFFREREGKPLTMFGTPAVAGRTIATDTRFFPKGALAFLSFEQPVFDPLATDLTAPPARFEPTSRFVVDDDTGGAIRGGGRVDLFWGSGADARRFAGWVKKPGRLCYLVPKPAPAVPAAGPGTSVFPSRVSSFSGPRTGRSSASRGSTGRKGR